MSQLLLPFVLGIFCFALIFAAWWLSRQGAWFITWVRGCLVVGIGVLVFFVLLLAYEVIRFDSVTSEAPLAVVSIKAVDDESFLAEVKYENEERWYTSLAGDAWQLQVRGLSFAGVSGLINSKPVAKVQSISTRYYDYARKEESRTIVVSPSNVDATFSTIGMNSWSMLAWIEPILNLLGIKREEHLASIVPLVDGTSYKVRWFREYVGIEPVNEAAQASLQSLQ